LKEFGRLFLGLRFTFTASCLRVATNTSDVFIQDCVMCLQFPVSLSKKSFCLVEVEHRKAYKIAYAHLCCYRLNVGPGAA
jgi:hypothetical protein